MRPFKYTRATTLSSAIKELSGNTQSRILAGGTNLLDLMKEDVERPEELIDITHLPHSPVIQLSQGAAKSGVLLDLWVKTPKQLITRLSAANTLC